MIQAYSREREERKTVKVEKQETDIPPITVGEVKSVPRMRNVKSTKTNDISPKGKHLTICDISGTKMRISINLMPVLAAAREPAEEEEEKEDDTSQITDTIINELVEQIPDLHCESYSGITLDFRQLSPQCVFPPISQLKPVPVQHDYHKTPWCHSALPPIRPSEQTRNILSNVLIKSLRGDLAVTGELLDNRPWMDNPLFSKSVSKSLNQEYFRSQSHRIFKVDQKSSKKTLRQTEIL